MKDQNEDFNSEELEKMYIKLRQSLSDERIELLHRYFNAMNNFYQIIPLKRMFRIINSQNEEQYSEEDFLSFAEIVRRENHYYYVLGKEELYDDVAVGKPFERVLIHESLMEFELYDNMNDAKCDRPYYVPSKDELLRYEDEYYEEKTPQYDAMAKFVSKNIERRADLVEEIMSEILFIVKGEDSGPKEAIDFLKKAGSKINFSEKQFDEFSGLYLDLHNNTRNPYNNGFTPTELFQKTGDEFESYYLQKPTFMDSFSNIVLKGSVSQMPVRSNKIGRNEPCPCGSGKKYKKCCGKM